MYCGGLDGLMRFGHRDEIRTTRRALWRPVCFTPGVGGSGRGAQSLGLTEKKQKLFWTSTTNSIHHDEKESASQFHCSYRNPSGETLLKQCQDDATCRSITS